MSSFPFFHIEAKKIGGCLPAVCSFWQAAYSSSSDHPLSSHLTKKLVVSWSVTHNFQTLPIQQPLSMGVDRLFNSSP
jgi:hypothetical protein